VSYTYEDQRRRAQGVAHVQQAILQAPPSEAECRALVDRILASQEFRRTVRLREFLVYVVDRKFAGARADLTEPLIGQRVFGRSASYNPSEDSIVRTEARNLRQRLERYFAGEGLEEPIVLEIPKGGYVPVFSYRPVSASDPAIPAPQQSRRKWMLWLASSAPVGVGAVGAWRFMAARREADVSSRAAAAVRIGSVGLESSNAALEQAFRGAKQRALDYAYTGDAVGDWYDSTAGERYAFCMRDVAHQSTGAVALGLNGHTVNMLRRFAASISESREWCGFWEINKDGFPAPVDYKDDGDFWYCLPANFDLMRACWQQFQWTNNPIFFDSVFSNFYDRSVTSYVEAWDRDGDGIMEGRIQPRRRGIPSYFQENGNILTGADLVAAQYAGYLVYAAIQERKGDRGSLSSKLADQYRQRAQALRLRYNAEWWDAARNRHYSAILADGTFDSQYIPDANIYSLLFGIPEGGLKTESALDWMEKVRPAFDQALSYYPEILFTYGRNQAAYKYLLEITDPGFKSRAMPEVTFAVVGAIVAGLMGVVPGGPKSTLATMPNLPSELAWVKVTSLPVLQNEIAVHHRGPAETTVTNQAGPSFDWRAQFPISSGTQSGRVLVDGVVHPSTMAELPNRRIVISATAPVNPGQTRTAEYVGR
jgi:hypothetical protein